MAGNQNISNMAKLKDLETQLELARARTETIEARVETIKALMKIDEIREKEAREKEAREKEAREKEAREKEAREKEAREKKPELLATTITDDTTCAPWESSYVSGVDARMTIAFSRKFDEIREKEAREKEFLKKEAVLEKEASEKTLARAAIEIAEARKKEVHEKKPVPTYNPKVEKLESLESNEAARMKLKQAELPSYDDDDTHAPWKDSCVTDTLASHYITRIYPPGAPCQKTFEETAKRIIENHAKKSQNHICDSFFIQTSGLYEDK